MKIKVRKVVEKLHELYPDDDQSNCNKIIAFITHRCLDKSSLESASKLTLIKGGIIRSADFVSLISVLIIFFIIRLITSIYILI